MAKVIVFSRLAEMVKILEETLDDMGVRYLVITGNTKSSDRASIQEEFHDPSIDVVLGTDAMSQGFNFVDADYVINYDDPWSPAITAQREDRAHRIGQKSKVNVVNFICKDTIEARVRQLLLSKSKTCANVLGDGKDTILTRGMSQSEIRALL